MKIRIVVLSFRIAKLLFEGLKARSLKPGSCARKLCINWASYWKGYKGFIRVWGSETFYLPSWLRVFFASYSNYIHPPSAPQLLSSFALKSKHRPRRRTNGNFDVAFKILPYFFCFAKAISSSPNEVQDAYHSYEGINSSIAVRREF